MRIIIKKSSSSFTYTQQAFARRTRCEKTRKIHYLYRPRDNIRGVVSRRYGDARGRNNGTTARAREIFVCRNLFLKPLPQLSRGCASDDLRRRHTHTYYNNTYKLYITSITHRRRPNSFTISASFVHVGTSKQKPPPKPVPDCIHNNAAQVNRIPQISAAILGIR